ncbi:MAG: methyltransferase domain-containing protein [Myxococcota bacterium]|nr:methyltransferase domain-containing protein [Myxococcota bacterium]
MGLRIPDDEVTRPSSVAPAGPVPGSMVNDEGPSDALAVAREGAVASSSAPVDGVLKPTRIISIDAEPTAAADTDPAVAPLRAAQDSAADLIGPILDDGPLTPRTGPPSAIDRAEPPLYDETPTPRRPGVPTPAATSPDGRSDTSEAELLADDLLSVEPPPTRPKAPASLPPLRALVAPLRPATASNKPNAFLPPARGKAPLVIVPPHVGSFAPSSMDAAGQRRKGRLWWEELFNDDYLRTTERMTDEQIAREVDFIEDSLSVERGGAVLDLACGTGRHGIELARRGYQVVAFDLSLAMLARAGDEAQERETKLNFVQGDMREMTFDEQFDGVYCWNTSFGYFEEDKNAQVIDRVRRALKGGGLLLLDVVNRDFLTRQSPSLAWFEGDGCVCMDEMNVDFITSRMRVKRTMMLDDGRSREIDYSMRVYSLHELGKILHEHGFKVCEVSGRIGTPGVYFGNESSRTIILAEKR